MAIRASSSSISTANDVDDPRDMKDSSKSHRNILNSWYYYLFSNVTRVIISIVALGGICFIILVVRNDKGRNGVDWSSQLRGIESTAAVLSSSQQQIQITFDSPPQQDSFKVHVRKVCKQYYKDVISRLRPPLVEQPPDERQLPFQTLLTTVTNWNPDTPEIPSSFKERIQHLDFGNPYERHIAELYRNAEIPFKLFNITNFEDVAAKWSDSYLTASMDSARTHVEKSSNNHFMFWTGARSIPNYVPPTEMIRNMDFPKWLEKAKRADTERLDNSSVHFYFMASAEARDRGRTFIARDLTSFSTKTNNFFITKVNKNKGIQCRFGMRGLIAEAHYDSGRNMVAMLKGSKRYIITPPWTCDRLGIISDTRHPSYRHSVIDWSDPLQAQQSGFDKVDAIDTIVHMGEVLYIPSFWFHYIVSLEYSVQCNSRSGFPDSMRGQEHITRCFKRPKK